MVNEFGAYYVDIEAMGLTTWTLMMHNSTPNGPYNGPTHLVADAFELKSVD